MNDLENYLIAEAYTHMTYNDYLISWERFKEVTELRYDRILDIDFGREPDYDDDEQSEEVTILMFEPITIYIDTKEELLRDQISKLRQNEFINKFFNISIKEGDEEKPDHRGLQITSEDIDINLRKYKVESFYKMLNNVFDHIAKAIS